VASKTSIAVAISTTLKFVITNHRIDKRNCWTTRLQTVRTISSLDISANNVVCSRTSSRLLSRSWTLSVIATFCNQTMLNITTTSLLGTYLRAKKEVQPPDMWTKTCQESHAYDRFLDTASFSRVKNRKNRVQTSSDEGLWLRSKRYFR